MPVALITPEALVGQTEAPCAVRLREAGFEVQYPRDKTFTRGLHPESETIRQLRDCDALLAGSEFVTENVLSSLPRLRVIARAGVGYDRVAVDAATERNVLVTITPTANHESVAEQTLALMLAIARQILPNDQAVRAGGWRSSLTEPVRGRTFGILGLGRIGRSVATRVAAMKMSVIACELEPDMDFVKSHGIELVKLDELLARSDYLSLHCPVTEQTRGLIDRDAIAKMKRSSVLINTARGTLVVEKDLIDALRQGHLRGAGLDVFEQEPTSADNPLFEMPQVVVSPHIGSADWLSQEMMGVEAAQCIVALFQGRWPEGAVVNDQIRDGWTWSR